MFRFLLAPFACARREIDSLRQANRALVQQLDQVRLELAIAQRQLRQSQPPARGHDGRFRRVAGHDPDHHFRRAAKMVAVGSGAALTH